MKYVLIDIVQYVHFCIPLAAHGSKEIVESWMKYRKKVASELDDDLKKGVILGSEEE